MSYWTDTRGKSSIGVGVCDRCHEKFPIVELYPDANSPGLKVCANDRDTLDPYRLPARPTENINLPFVRPDEDLSFVQQQCPIEVIGTETTAEGLESEGASYFGAPAAIQVESVDADEACDTLHYGIYGGKLLNFGISVEVVVDGSDVIVSWPSSFPFVVDHFEVYAYHDVIDPTSSSYQLITTLPAGSTSYEDTTVYGLNFGYIVVAVGTNGEQATSTAVQQMISDTVPVVGPEVRIIGRPTFGPVALVFPGPGGDLGSLTQFALPWDPASFSQQCILAWSDDLLYFVTAAASAPTVWYSSSSGPGSGNFDPTNGVNTLQPISVRAELNSSVQRVWVGYQEGAVVGMGVFWMTGTTYDMANVFPIVVGGLYDAAIVEDANSFDSGASVLALGVRYVSGVDCRTSIYSLNVGTGIWTELFGVDKGAPAIEAGTLARMPVTGLYCAVTCTQSITSPDGVTWTLQAPPPWAVDNGGVKVKITAGYVGGTLYFVATMEDRGTYYYSEDGISWTTVVYSPDVVFLDNAIQGGYLALVGYDIVFTFNSVLVQCDDIGTPVPKSTGYLSADMTSVAAQVVSSSL